MHRPHVVGIDQTGAATRGGRGAKPLPGVHLRHDGTQWTLSTTTFPSLSAEALGATGATLVCVDAVLGLPETAWPLTGCPPNADGLRTLFRHAADAARGYGRAPAEAFFGTFDPGGDGLRVQDRQLGAQSVFRSVPYQRQVLTGTYRVWRDLGRSPEAFSLHGFEPPDPGRPHLAEGWPTWGWRTLIGERTRRPTALPAWLRAHGVRLGDADADVLVTKPDHADAAVAALCGAFLQASALHAPAATPPGEGAVWAVGTAPG